MSISSCDGPRRARFAVYAATLAAFIAVPSSGQAADVRKGQEVYNTHCFTCHGPGGRPRMPGAPDFSRHQRLMRSDVALLASIRGGLNAMPGYRGVLRNEDILDVISYIRTF